MNKKATHYIYILFTLFSFNGFFAQDYILKITSNKDLEKSILKDINYTTNHNDTTSVNLEIKKVSYFLKKEGYFTNQIDSIKKEDKQHIVYFSLSKKTEEAIIRVKNDYIPLFKETGYEISKNRLIISTDKIENILSKLTSILDNQGQSFSTVQLENIFIEDNKLFADLNIKQSTKRTIQKVTIKDYEDFPKSYLKNYFNIKNNTVFSKNKIEEISELSKNLEFVREIKKPEALFTKDSTSLYIYLKKRQNNSFDGILNFASQEEGEITFNGNANLKLVNTLNKGEEFSILWNSIEKERQELQINIKTPYIFNSKISPEISFNIYKQDSSYINSSFESKLKYNINNNLKLGFSYISESSENLTSKNLTTNYESFTSNFFGLNFSYTKHKNDLFFNKKFHLTINPFLGKRTTNKNSSNQLKIKTISSYILDINNRSSIYIKNEIGYLFSESYLTNELFRIGGANSIRGYTEQSIFTNKFSYINLEYRYLTSKKSYLYSISDIGQAKINNSNQFFLGLGLGYLFTTNNSQINLSIITSKNNSESVDLKNIKLLIRWKNFF
ncbi:hypothetical protein [Polaribacter sp. Asnod1-A03]|uniref:hypothetical protein n=1 Tax=Polaribacter sp. Asnod1-A03 TaxID=3160581 RepID=UPI0038657ECE